MQSLYATPAHMSDIIDLGPETDDFRSALLEGLSGARKSIPCKFLYDERGSELFEGICELEEYYPTRTEIGIMESEVGAMAERVGPRARIVEFGAGSGRKTRLLLRALEAPVSYLPIEISKSALRHCAAAMGEEFPGLEVVPICADYTEEVELPEASPAVEKTVAYFPGSTIGNFEPDEAVAFLARIAGMCGSGGGLLIGVDLFKSPEIIEPAYDDSRGVTREFTSNLLRRANREAGADFDLEHFDHRAIFNQQEGRVEIYQVSQRQQTVHVGDRAFEFDAGEAILTEHSYKYTPERFRGVAEAAGFGVAETWTDADELFSVWYLRA